MGLAQGRNPGGRPKVSAEIRGLARDHGARAIAGLVALIDSKNESVAVRAAEALLDHGYGRPMRGLDVSKHEGRLNNTVIRVHFVMPPKREEAYSIPQRPCLIGILGAK